MNMFYRHHDYKRATDRIGCSSYTVRRWENRIVPYRMTGGRQKDKLTGADKLLLSICVFIYPDASSDDIFIFVINNGL